MMVSGEYLPQSLLFADKYQQNETTHTKKYALWKIKIEYFMDG